MMIRLLSALKSIATTCGVCAIVCLAAPVAAQTGSPISNTANDEEIASMLRFAELAKASGNLDRASDLLQIAMNMSSTDEAKLKQTLIIALQYAESLEAINANFEAVCIYNLLGLAVTGPLMPFNRAVLFEKLGWTSAMLSELRVAHRLDPKRLDAACALAANLALAEKPELRNAEEALAVALSVRDQIENAPLIAQTIGRAAAASKDFDLAVEMQTKYLKSGTVSQEELPIENRRLELYLEKSEPPAPQLPVFTSEDLLSNETIANIARRSMVGVRVQGIVEGKDAKTGAVQVRASIRWAVGTVLDSFGTFLVSSESVRVPTYGELFVPETQAEDRSLNSFATRAKLIDKLGSTRWLETPEIGIYSMPSATVQSKSMGEAGLLGSDEATGLAVIELKRESAFSFIRHAEWQPAKFTPEHRTLDPSSNQLDSGLELDYTPTDFISTPNLVALKSIESTICAYFDRPSGVGHKARLISLPESKCQPGSALFNQLGEIVGIKHQIDAPATDGQFAIPAHVCTRIAAKLASYGEVHRAHLPFVLVANTTGVTEPAMGMKVNKVPTDVSVYQPLLNKLIISLDGVPTPTLTEWLIASERIYDRGLETALVEVFDPELKLVSWMTIPTTKPN